MIRLRTLFILPALCLVHCRQADKRESEPFDTNFHEIYTYRNGMQLDRAMEMFDSAYGLIEDPGTYHTFKRLDFKEWYYKNKHDYTLALIYSDSTLDLLEDKEAFKTDYVRALIVRAYILVEVHQYADALKCLYDAKAFTDEKGDPCSATELNLFMGDVLYKQDKYTDALEHYREAYASCQLCTETYFRSSFVVVQNAMNSMALCFEKTDRPDSAIFYYQKALDFVERWQSTSNRHVEFMETAKGVICGNLGNAEMTLGQYNKAEAHFWEGIRINSKKGYDNRDAFLTGIKMGYLHLKRGETAEAEQVLNGLEENLQEMPFPTGELRFKKLRWDVYKLGPDTGRTYRAYLDYTLLKEKHDSAQRELPGISLTQGFFNLSQRDQLHSLIEKEEMRNLYLWAALAFSLTLVAILYLIRKNLRESKRHVKNLNTLNSEARSQNIQLREALDALEISHAENSRVMRMVAHDLRNPVGGMVSLASLLMDEKEISQEVKEMLQMIYTLGNDSMGLMQDLLTLKSELHGLHTTEVDIYELLRYSIDLMRLKANEKNQVIHLEGSSCILLLHREKIWRVLSNLLSNAIKFSEVGKEITVTMKALPGCMRIEVLDEGIGIPEEWKDKVFGMLTEVRRRGTSGEKAFGLGLAISRQIVEAHDGKIGYEARSGGGTCFYIELPR